MLVHFLDVDRLDDSTGTDGVDGTIRIAETDGAVPLPLPLEGMVSETRNSSGSLETLNTY
jgi:hypothetical protein